MIIPKWVQVRVPYRLLLDQASEAKYTVGGFPAHFERASYFGGWAEFKMRLVDAIAAKLAGIDLELV